MQWEQETPIIEITIIEITLIEIRISKMGELKSYWSKVGFIVFQIAWKF